MEDTMKTTNENKMNEDSRRIARIRRQLLPDEVRDRLPMLYSQEERGMDAVAQVKFFTPWTSWTWYASEYDPTEELFFGVVVGLEREFGYFALAELVSISVPGGLSIDRDEFWTPRPLRDCA
jgi:hypothetical protein